MMLRMIGYGDTVGSEFPTTFAAWAEKGWPEPELQEDTILDQVTLVLKNDLKSDGVLGSENGNSKETTKKTTKEKVVELIQSNPDISANEIAEIIGISSDGVRYHINKMKQEGVFTREEPNKGGRWIINIK